MSFEAEQLSFLPFWFDRGIFTLSLFYLLGVKKLYFGMDVLCLITGWGKNGFDVISLEKSRLNISSSLDYSDEDFSMVWVKIFLVSYILSSNWEIWLDVSFKGSVSFFFDDRIFLLKLFYKKLFGLIWFTFACYFPSIECLEMKCIQVSMFT